MVALNSPSFSIARSSSQLGNISSPGDPRSSPAGTSPDGVVGNHSQKSACLACRKRKIKCDRLLPCTACNQSGIECGFMASARAKSRSKVLQKLRKAPVEEQIRMNRQFAMSQHATASLDTKLVSPMLLYQCTKVFFAKCFPINILFDLPALEEMTSGYALSPRKYAFAAAFCAVVIYSCPEIPMLELEDRPTSSAVLSARLIEASLHARAFDDYIVNTDQPAILCSFFLSNATFQLTSDKKGWYYLRETCTLMESESYHVESFYHQSSRSDEYLYRTRLLYFLISISERGNSLHRTHPVTLDHSISFPLMDNNDPVQRGFAILHELFAPFDKTFTSFRDAGILNIEQTPDQYVLDLHRRVTVACPPYSFFASFHRPFPDTVTIDLLVTKQWLFLKIYHLTLHRSLLSYASQEADLGLLYPIKIARELIEIWDHFDHDSVEVHGMSMFEKLFDISVALADLLQVVPISTTTPPVFSNNNRVTYGYGPQDLLQILVKLVSQMRRARNDYLPKLLDKVQRCIAADESRPEVTQTRQQFYDTVSYEFEDLFNLHINSESGLLFEMAV